MRGCRGVLGLGLDICVFMGRIRARGSGAWRGRGKKAEGSRAFFFRRRQHLQNQNRFSNASFRGVDERWFSSQITIQVVL